MRARGEADRRIGTTANVDVWNLASSTMKTTIVGHSNHIYSLDPSRDEGILLTGCNDSADTGLLALWDIGAWTLEGTMPAHGAGVRVIAFSADSKLFATARSQRSARSKYGRL